MNDYTVVYMIRVGNGGYNSSVTQFKHISCTPDGLVKAIETAINNDLSAVWFVFDGHCKMTTD